jgi:hypothetical protein
VSFDLAVWYPDQRFTNEEALSVYRALCEGDQSGLQPNPSVAAFYAEFAAVDPEIDDVPDERIDDHDFCLWSVAYDRSDRHVIFCCVWPKSSESRATAPEWSL